MSSVNVERILDAATALLDTVVGVYADPVPDVDPPSPVSLPARQYLSTGNPADDCDQIVVVPGPLSPGFLGNTPLLDYSPCNMPFVFAVGVHLARCAPVTIQPTGADVLQAAAEDALRDLYLLTYGVRRYVADNSVFDGCEHFVVTQGIINDASGGLYTVDVSYQIQL